MGWTPLAITFVHPFVLGGLALASLPIIIHLLNRRRFKRMDWAAMEFLLKAAVRNRRRVRLENLLLLMLRTLIVLLLVLAVARPFTSRESGLAGVFGAEGKTERIILLDNSHSMRAGQGNTPAFKTAQRLLHRFVKRLNEERSGDRITVVLGSDPRGGDQQLARVAVASAHANRLIERIDKLHPGDGVLDLVEAIDSILEEHSEDDARLVLHVVSDFRTRDWASPDGTPRADVAEAMDRFSQRGEIRFLDVGSRPIDNLGIVDLKTRERAVIAGVPTSFVATVRNYGPSPASNFSVEFRMGGLRVTRKFEGTLEAGKEAEFVHEFTPRAEGAEVVSARLPTDLLPGDDARHLVVGVREAMRFLLVDGEPDPEAYRGEVDFLAAALAPPGKTSSGIAVDAVEEQLFTGRELDLYDAVFLCNVYRLPPERVGKLEEYVRAGGGLVFFLGDQVDPQVYNATLLGQGDKEGQGLLPLRLHEAEGSSDDYVHLAPPDTDHPITRFLRGMNQIVFRMLSVRRYVRCSLPPRTDARVILKYTDEEASPALAEKRFGEGRVLLVTTAADREWSNLPGWFLYLPLLQEMGKYIVRPDPGDWTRVVGEPIELRFDPKRMRRSVTLTLPDSLGGAPLRLAPDPEEMVFRYDRTTVRGVYRLSLKTPEGEEFERPYAFNLDSTEGDLRRAEIRKLAAAFPGVRLERAGDDSLFDTGDSDRTEFWRTLMYVLIVCVVLETLLAWRFGHHGRRKDAGVEGKQVFVR